MLPAEQVWIVNADFIAGCRAVSIIVLNSGQFSVIWIPRRIEVHGRAFGHIF